MFYFFPLRSICKLHCVQQFCANSVNLMNPIVQVLIVCARVYHKRKDTSKRDAFQSFLHQMIIDAHFIQIYLRIEFIQSQCEV